MLLQGAQAALRPGSVEGHREGLAQQAALSVIADQPEGQTGLGVGVDV